MLDEHQIMRPMKAFQYLLTTLLMATGLLSASAQLATTFTYQGKLATTNGPADGLYDFVFALYDDAGEQVGANITNLAVSVTEGYSTHTLDFGPNSFRRVFIPPRQFVGPGEWLEIQVRTNRTKTYQTLAPRQRLTPTPYAAAVTTPLTSSALEGNYSGKVTFGNSSNVFLGTYYGDGANITNIGANSVWSLTGNAGTTAGAHFLGTTDNKPLELRVNNMSALRLEPQSASPNIVGGYIGNLAAAGISGAVVSGGGSSTGTNQVTANFGTVGGGSGNAAASTWATIGGGRDNKVQTSSGNAVIGGGSLNIVGSNAGDAVIAGGQANAVSADAAKGAVGGGAFNQATGAYSSVGGGERNRAADHGAVGGGLRNLGTGNFSTIAGGQDNAASGAASAVLGGQTNSASASFATVAGGYYNRASDNYTTIGGGADNRARGLYATVPGGRENDAYGDYSFAAGRRAHAWGDGSFVWADSQDTDFVAQTSQSNVFWVRATGGARFQTGTNAFWTEAEMSCATLTIRGGADLAEPFAMSDHAVPAGSVVVIDPEHPGRLKLSTSAYDRKVAGIVSGAGGVQPGISMIQEDQLEGGRNVALSGRVYALVDASVGGVQPGDLLTTSEVPGHAMRVENPAQAQGAILGKAMTPLPSGRGLVLVLVTLQ